MPSYTPEFNSIEALWGWIKCDVKNRLVFHKYETLDRDQFVQMLTQSLGSITYEMQANAARYNNRNFLHRTLTECIKREDFPHLFLDQRQDQSNDAEFFMEDPLLVDDVDLLDRLDVEVDSQQSIDFMFNRYQPTSNAQQLS